VSADTCNRLHAASIITRLFPNEFRGRDGVAGLKTLLLYLEVLMTDEETIATFEVSGSWLLTV